MPVASWPRLSQAKDLLPIIRGHLVAAAAHHTLPAGLSLELLPIVEDGLVGYEFLPNQATNTYLTIGCDDRGIPVLRERSYRGEPSSALRVAAVNGRALSQGERVAGQSLRRRDAILSDWTSAAEAAWIELAALFPQQPRHDIEVDESEHECLDEALALAHEHLVDWDPCIDFCGVPDEAQYGFALTHANGGHGLLASRQPGQWALWFQCPHAALNEEWSIAPLTHGASAWASAGAIPRYTAQHAALLFPANKTESPARTHRRGTSGDRREGDDRRSADRRHADRRHGDRRSSDSFDADRLVERRHQDRRRRDRRDRASH
jgi:hypothetical protein